LFFFLNTRYTEYQISFELKQIVGVMVSVLGSSRSLVRAHIRSNQRS